MSIVSGPHFTVRPTKFKSFFLDRQNVSLRKIWSTFQEKEQNSEADIPDFRVGFFEILEEDKRRMEKDEHDEDNSTWELDDFIAAERSSNTKGENTKYE